MCDDDQINRDYEFLQSSDHFYYMATKFFSDGSVHTYFNPYETPYDAFMNYMNILSDFEIRVNRAMPPADDHEKVVKLEELIKEKELIIEKQASEIEKLTKKTSGIKGRKKVEAVIEPKTSLKELAKKIMKGTTKKTATKSVKTKKTVAVGISSLKPEKESKAGTRSKQEKVRKKESAMGSAVKTTKKSTGQKRQSKAATAKKAGAKTNVKTKK